MAERRRFGFGLSDAEILDGAGNRFVPQKPRDQRDIFARPIHMRWFAAPDRMAGVILRIVPQHLRPCLDDIGIVRPADWARIPAFAPCKHKILWSLAADFQPALEIHPRRRRQHRIDYMSGFLLATCNQRPDRPAWILDMPNLRAQQNAGPKHRVQSEAQQRQIVPILAAQQVRFDLCYFLLRKSEFLPDHKALVPRHAGTKSGLHHLKKATESRFFQKRRYFSKLDQCLWGMKPSDTPDTAHGT